MSTNNSGINNLAYTGVVSAAPPQFEKHTRAPRVTDYLNFIVGTIWLDISGLKLSPPVLPTNENIWMLVSKDKHVATWVNFGGGDLETITGDTGGVIGRDANDNINIITNVAAIDAGASVSFIGDPATNTLKLSVTSNPGGNIFIGEDSGNLTLTSGVSVQNTALGAATLASLTTGLNNTIVGNGGGSLITTGEDNTSTGIASLSRLVGGSANSAYGSRSLEELTSGNYNTTIGDLSGGLLDTGSYNIFLGYVSGISLVGAESSNIMINNQGVAGESHIIRIGTNGVGDLQQNTTYLHGGNVLKPSTSAFSATLAGAVANVTGNGADYTIIYGTESFDQNANYNNATGVFTAPIAGKYFFTASCLMGDLAGATTGRIAIVTSVGLDVYGTHLSPDAVASAAGNVSFSVNGLISLALGETVHVTIQLTGLGGDTADIIASANYNYFSGYLVC